MGLINAYESYQEIGSGTTVRQRDAFNNLWAINVWRRHTVVPGEPVPDIFTQLSNGPSLTFFIQGLGRCRKVGSYVKMEKDEALGCQCPLLRLVGDQWLGEYCLVANLNKGWTLTSKITSFFPPVGHCFQENKQKRRDEGRDERKIIINNKIIK